MSAVFSHGRLRLYLLRLLAEAPRHGYDLIRLLEEQFRGRYAPSAGTIYPRLQRMESEGLVTHTASGGRKVYEITDAGRAELAARAEELAVLETDIRAVVEELTAIARDVRDQVRGSVRDAQKAFRSPPPPSDAFSDLEHRATLILDEVRRLARTGRASTEAVRATLVVLDAALDQVRRLLR
jgi:DNA-binding PadR family transcriptional regulator